ncbi:MAG TPA: hypothetical protein VFT22_39145 [Kofleriaceae bacterium]|nr:hypothetical protein [Kofleriaceae bacterium]
MKSPDNLEPLREELARFTIEVQRLTLAIVRDILRKEVDLLRTTLAQPAIGGALRAARLATPPAPAPARGRTRRGAAGPRTPPPPEPPAEPQQQPAAPEPTSSPPAAESPEPSSAPAQAAPPASGRKRSAWTRESIIEELASFILSGTEIDATFVQRHGPPGLVAAARRIFGRFDAALNVAGLHVSKLYPEGPPGQNARAPTRVR